MFFYEFYSLLDGPFAGLVHALQLFYFSNHFDFFLLFGLLFCLCLFLDGLVIQFILFIENFLSFFLEFALPLPIAVV
jgi:hypothetical protein